MAPPSGSDAPPALPSETKPAGYYSNAREDLIGELPRPLGRVLDVGCGDGSVGRALKREGATSVSGIEVNVEAAERARAVLDEVAVGRVEDMLPRLTGPWDTICAYDVLEHLVDPDSVVVALREQAAPGCRLHVSAPNARHVSLLADLVLRGTFGYTEWGHRDSTHLRWFTRRDIVDLLERSGWRVIQTSHPALHRARALDVLTRGRSTEFLVGQWYVLATVGLGGSQERSSPPPR